MQGLGPPFHAYFQQFNCANSSATTQFSSPPFDSIFKVCEKYLSYYSFKVSHPISTTDEDNGIWHPKTSDLINENTIIAQCCLFLVALAKQFKSKKFWSAMKDHGLQWVEARCWFVLVFSDGPLSLAIRIECDHLFDDESLSLVVWWRVRWWFGV